jgi:uncharacterized phiE125 gp8 family phage protein
MSFPPFVIPFCGCHSATGTTPGEWDFGITHRTVRTIAPTEDAAIVAAVREKVLRVVNGSVEDGHIEHLIRAATSKIQNDYNVALKPQTFQLTMTGFPSGKIRLKFNPVIEIVSFGYVDGDGNDQTLAVSPPDFQLLPSGGFAWAELYPSAGASWPSTLTGSYTAVTITYQSGYADDSELDFIQYQQGLLLAVGELYKQRELSVVGTSIVPAPFGLQDFCPRWY